MRRRARVNHEVLDLQRFLGHESITMTPHYAETTAATLQRSFGRITDPAAHDLIVGIRQQRGGDAALIAANLLAWLRAERVSTAGVEGRGARPCGIWR